MFDLRFVFNEYSSHTITYTRDKNLFYLYLVFSVCVSHNSFFST